MGTTPQDTEKVPASQEKPETVSSAFDAQYPARLKNSTLLGVENRIWKPRGRFNPDEVSIKADLMLKRCNDLSKVEHNLAHLYIVADKNEIGYFNEDPANTPKGPLEWPIWRTPLPLRIAGHHWYLYMTHMKSVKINHPPKSCLFLVSEGIE